MASHMASSSMRADAKICCIFLGAEQCHGQVTWCGIPKVVPQFGIAELNITSMIWDDLGGIRVFKGVMNQQRVHCGGHLAVGDGHQSIPNMAWDDPKHYRMEYHVLTQAIWSLAAIERGH